MYIVRYDGPVSDDTITETSQVAIEEASPPAGTTGIQTKKGLVVCEPTNDRGEAPKAYEFSSLDEMQRYLGRPSPYIGSAADGYEGNLHVQSEKMPGLYSGGLVVVTVNAEAGTATLTRPSPGTASRDSVSGPFVLSPGDVLSFATEAGAQTATFDAANGTLTGAAATYAACTVGHTLDVKIDGGTTQSIACAGTENTQALWHDLINAALLGGSAVNAGGQTKLASDLYGTDSSVQVLASSDSDVLAALGLSAATGTGTGDVGNIQAVTAAEAKTVIEADTVGVVTLTADGSGFNLATPTAGAGGSINVTAGGANDAFGMTTGLLAGGTGTAPSGRILAGTRLSGAGSTVWLTLEDVVVAEDDGTPGGTAVTVRCRAASGTTGSGVALTGVIDQPSFDTTWTASGSMTAADLDTAYATAAASVVADASNQYARRAGRFAACRHTAAVQSAMTAAVAARSTSGRGALYVASPPIGTNKTTAEGSSGAGVAASASGGRTDRKQYAWPPYQGRTSVTGTTALVDFPADLTAIMLHTKIDPEESIGDADKLKTYMTHIVAMGADAGVLEYADYVSLKASGILALRIDPDVGAFFQDDVVTSLTSGRTQTPRRTMVDYLGDSAAVLMLRYKAKPFRGTVRDDAENDLDTFNETLKGGPNQVQRIFDGIVDEVSTGIDRRNGILRLNWSVDLLGNIGTVKLQLAAQAGLLEVIDLSAA